MILYTLQLKGAGQFDDHFYHGKSQFGKEKRLFTKKEISAHLNRAIKRSHDYFGAKIIIKTYKVEEKDSFSVSSLEEFKTFENRMNKIEELLNGGD